MYKIKYWVQDTIESGHFEYFNKLFLTEESARNFMYDMRDFFSRGEIEQTDLVV